MTYFSKEFWWCSKSPVLSMLEAFPISALKKRLICRKSTFSPLFNIFLWKYCHALCSYSQSLWYPKYNKIDIITKPILQEVTQCHRTHSVKYNRFRYSSVSNKKALVLHIGYNLLNLSLGLFQTFSHSFTDSKNCILIKFSCNKRMQYISSDHNKNQLI